MNPARLLQRFLRYVRIDTMANDQSEAYPSSPGQRELGRVVAEELRAAGVPRVEQDEQGVVAALLPADSGTPIAFCAHLDTSPETSGAGVKPQVVENYRGGDLVLPGDTAQVIRVAEHPELAEMIGRTLVTSDGTTLLGADDKAGVAVIVETLAWLVEHPELPHGPIQAWFTCDEEIGRGVNHLGPYLRGQWPSHPGAATIPAPTACYTLDGSGADTIDVETFSADLLVATVRGVNIHPGVAKGRMVNAVRVAAALLARLPRGVAPEATADREPFLHPYEISGGVAEVKLRMLLRDFQTAGLRKLEALVRDAAAATLGEFPGAAIDIAVTPQYRNMAEGLVKEPRAVAYAEKALQRLGRRPQLTIVRGGTDGSRLTELGLPTPNLATGQHCPHSKQEWACLEEMVQAAQWLVALAACWAEPYNGIPSVPAAIAFPRRAGYD